MTNPVTPGDNDQPESTPQPSVPGVPPVAPQAPVPPAAPQSVPAPPAAPQAAPYQAGYQNPQAGYGVPGPGGYFDGAVSPDDLSRPLYGATFGQAIRRFFKNYVNFKGRASRSEFWFAQLFQAIILLVPMLLMFIGTIIAGGAALASESGAYNDAYEVTAASGAGLGLVLVALGGIVSGVISLGLLIPMLSIHWRRLHDANFAGPFFFLSLTSIGAIIVLVFTILPSKVEGRRFDVAR